MYTNPVVDDFKNHFHRDFPYTDNNSDLTKIHDADINTALAEAALAINPNLFSSQASYSLGFLHLTAHCLVTNLRNSSQGLNGTYAFLENSKGVGNVSQSFGIPPKFLDIPQVSMLLKTNYGAKYVSMILPHLIGPMHVSLGRTSP